MIITDEKLKKLAKLARIEIKDNEKDKIKSLLEADINEIKDINNIDINGLEPIINPYDLKLETFEDIVKDGDKQEDLMKCAPQSMYNYFIVPKVVE